MMDESQWKQILPNELSVGKQIGGGGVGVIYSGTYLNQSVALKTLFDPRIDQETKKEFMDELLVMSKLKHPNIVRFIGACLEQPKVCFVMELCTGSLYELLHVTRKDLQLIDQIEIAAGIANGMKYLHSLKPMVVHRDLKSQNVLFDANGAVKLCDFGLVSTKEITAGTPAYMPPELLSGKPFSKAVDIYMFGILLWELFSFDIPFRGYDVSDIQRKVIAGDRPRIPTANCPEICQELIQQCWDETPTNRPEFDEIFNILTNIDISHHTATRATDMVEEEDALDSLIKRK